MGILSLARCALELLTSRSWLKSLFDIMFGDHGGRYRYSAKDTMMRIEKRIILQHPIVRAPPQLVPPEAKVSVYLGIWRSRCDAENRINPES